MPLDTSLVGIGLYSVGEVARLTGVSAPRIRRWLRGYHYSHHGREVRSEPLWRPQIPDIEGELALGFRDLAEIRIVNALVEAGLGLPTVRRAMQLARTYVHDERPFSTTRFKTDGHSIFLEIEGEAEKDDDAGEPRLLDLLRRQYGFRKVIEPSLKDLEFDADAAIRWWPLSRRHAVVLDPARSFGAPIVHDGGVATDALAAAVDAEGSVDIVARLYGVTASAVRDAVAFERRRAA